MSGRRHQIQLSLLLLILSALFCTSLASASGRVVWKKTNLSESSESWKIDVQFHMRRAPDFAHMPMVFTFTPTTYFERSLVDGNDKPQIRKVPLENRQPLIETVDVGFLDPGSGKIQPRTRFTFEVTRDRGFEAGEYTVKVKNKRTGANLGGATRLTLNGDNEVIDRRSMVFESKKKKKEEKASELENSEPEYDPKKDPNSDAYWAGGPTEPEQEAALPPPAEVEGRPGACAVTPGSDRRSGPMSLLSLMLALTLGLMVRFRRPA